MVSCGGGWFSKLQFSTQCCGWIIPANPTVCLVFYKSSRITSWSYIHLCSVLGLSTWHLLILWFPLVGRSRGSVRGVPLYNGRCPGRTRMFLSVYVCTLLLGVALIQQLPVFLLQEEVLLTLWKRVKKHNKALKSRKRSEWLQCFLAAPSSWKSSQ